MAAETFQTNETETKLSKIYCSAPVHGKARPLVINPTKIGSTLSPEERPARLRDPLIAEPIH